MKNLRVSYFLVIFLLTTLLITPTTVAYREVQTALAPKSDVKKTAEEGMIAVCRRHFEHGSTAEKLWAIDQLVILRAYPEAGQILIGALDDGDVLVRAYSARALGDIGSREAVPKLSSLLSLHREEEAEESTPDILQPPHVKAKEEAERSGNERAAFCARRALKQIAMKGDAGAAAALKAHTFYLTSEEFNAELRRARTLRTKIKNEAEKGADRDAVERLARDMIAMYERLVVALDYSEKILAEYHRECREWEQIRMKLGWDREHHHFLIIIHTFNRPDSLKRLVASVIGELKAFNYGGRENNEWKKVRILIVDDSNNQKKIEINKQFVASLKGEGIRVEYCGEKEQKALITELDREAEGARAEQFVMKSQQALKSPHEITFAAKGYAGIRNMARLAAAKSLVSMPANTLVVNLDDDVEMAKLVEKNGVLSKEHFISYFAAADRAFSQNPSLSLLGGGYKLDARNADEALIPALIKLTAFFAEAARESPRQRYRNEPFSGFRPWKDSGGGFLEKAFAEFFEEMIGFRAGKFPNLARTYRPEEALMRGEWSNESLSPAKFLWGGNVIMRPSALRSELPYFDMPRGEDMLFLQMYQLLYPDLVCSMEKLSLIHNRTPEERPDLYEEYVKSFQSWAVLGPLTSFLKFRGTDKRSLRAGGIPAIMDLLMSEAGALDVIMGKSDRLQKTNVLLLRMRFEEIARHVEEINRYVSDAEGGYWWNDARVLDNNKELKEQRKHIKKLFAFLRKFYWSPDAEKDFQERIGAAFDSYYERFKRAVKVLPEWKEFLNLVELQELSRGAADALFGERMAAGEEFRLESMEWRYAVFKLGDLIVKIPKKKTVLPDGAKAPVDFARDMLQPNLLGKKRLGGQGIGMTLIRNIAIPAEKFPQDEVSGLQVEREGDSVIIQWAIAQDIPRGTLIDEIQRLYAATLLDIPVGKLSPSESEDISRIPGVKRANGMFSIPLFRQAGLEFIREIDTAGYERAVEASGKLTALVSAFYGLQRVFLARGLFDPAMAIDGYGAAADGRVICIDYENLTEHPMRNAVISGHANPAGYIKERIDKSAVENAALMNKMGVSTSVISFFMEEARIFSEQVAQADFNELWCAALFEAQRLADAGGAVASPVRAREPEGRTDEEMRALEEFKRFL